MLFFGHHQRKYHEIASSKYQQTAKWELSVHDTRLANNIEKLFFKNIKILSAKVYSSIWVQMRKGKLKNCLLAARDVTMDTNIEKILSSNIGFKDFGALRTLPDYRETLKKNLFAMV